MIRPPLYGVTGVEVWGWKQATESGYKAFLTATVPYLQLHARPAPSTYYYMTCVKTLFDVLDIFNKALLDVLPEFFSTVFIYKIY